MRFFAKSPCPYGFGGNTFFIDLNFTFCGLEKVIFQSVWRFSEIEGRLYKIEGRLHKIEGHLYKIEGRIYKIEGRLYKIEGRLYKIGDLCLELWAFFGGKTPKKAAKFFLQLWDGYKKYILQKKWIKTSIPALSSG